MIRFFIRQSISMGICMLLAMVLGGCESPCFDRSVSDYGESTDVQLRKFFVSPMAAEDVSEFFLSNNIYHHEYGVYTYYLAEFSKSNFIILAFFDNSESIEVYVGMYSFDDFQTLWFSEVSDLSIENTIDGIVVIGNSRGDGPYVSNIFDQISFMAIGQNESSYTINNLDAINFSPTRQEILGERRSGSLSKMNQKSVSAYYFAIMNFRKFCDNARCP